MIEAPLLSEILKQPIVALPERLAIAMLILICQCRFGWGTPDAGVVQIAGGRLQAVADLAQRHAVGKLTEYHAHQVTPRVESLGVLVSSVFLYDV